MNNQTDIGIKFTNKVTNERKIEKYREELSKIYVLLKAMDKGKMLAIQNTTSATTEALKEQNKLMQTNGSESQKMARNFNLAFNYTTLRVFTRALKHVVSATASMTKQSSSFVENMNLLDVAFNNNTIEAEKFVNKLSEMYGLDESWGYRTVGIFKQLANAMGISAEAGTKLSQILTQLSIDTSSLYNIDTSEAVSIFSSALAGQTKPARRLGADITQSTLQKTLDTAGIKEYVANLSYAEKRLVIVASLLQQLTQANNDWGRTIESVANQTRIMSEQWDRLNRALGNVFLPILGKILPYLNAILMVFTEIISSIATLVGYNPKDYDYFGETDESVIDLKDNLAGANANAKKLNSSLRSFDKLNNITTNNGAKSGISGSGISPEIMKLFNSEVDKYNSSLTDVQMKATKIRDRIMEWLGYTKLTDEETGDVSFKFDHITGGTVLGALAVGGTIFKGISVIYKLLKGIGLFKFPLLSKLGGLFGGGTAADTVSGASKIASSTKSFKVPNVKDVLKGLADVAIVIGGTVLLATAIGAFMQIPNIKQITTDGIAAVVGVFSGLAKILIPLALVGAGMVALGSLGGKGIASVAIGLADLAIVIIGTTAVVTAIGALMQIKGFQQSLDSGIANMIKVFNGISEICLPLLGVTAGLALLGFTGAAGVGAIVVGLADMALVIGGMEVVLAAIGKLSQSKFISGNIDAGINSVIKLADGIGKFAGTLVSSFIDKATEGLGNVGSHLSEFMTNASGFFNNVGNIDAETAQAVSYLANAILSLTTSQVISGLTSWFAGKASLTKFGEDLQEFAPHFKKYTQELSGVGKASIEKTKIVGEVMSIIIGFAKEIPNSGGVLGFLVGNNDLADLSKVLPDFGKNIADYSQNVNGVSESVVEKTKNIAEAMNKIIDFAKRIPNDGGVLGFFVGNNNIADFGKNIKDFGSYFAQYSKNIANINVDKVNSINKALSDIVDMAEKINDKGLKSSIKDFATSLKDSSSSITDFYKNALSAEKGTSVGTTFGNAIATAIVTAIKNKKFPSIKLTDVNNPLTGKLADYKITAYANGGMLPPVGNLFLMNEHKPELLGTIGGKSFVANQEQMMDLLDKKIGNAQTNKTPTTINIYLDANHKLGTYTLEQLQNMAKSNGQPIEIGG